MERQCGTRGERRTAPETDSRDAEGARCAGGSAAGGGRGGERGGGGEGAGSVRPATSEDLEALLLIESACFDQERCAESLARDLDAPQAHVLLALSADGAPAGYIDYWIVVDELEVHDIAVAPAQRRQGHARRLLEHALLHARGEGVRQVFLEVRESNEAARRLYEQHGFVLVGWRRNYYKDGREDAMLLRLELAHKR